MQIGGVSSRLKTLFKIFKLSNFSLSVFAASTLISIEKKQFNITCFSFFSVHKLVQVYKAWITSQT